MKDYLIDFQNMRWESPAAGIRYKSFIKGAQKIRLVEFTDEFREKDWCVKEHIGYILEGSMAIDFDGELIRYGVGDGIFIEEGSRHKARVDKGEKALIVLFENARRYSLEVNKRGGLRMRPELAPITGRENKKDLAAPLKALVEFYDAFNSQDLEKMSRNWAQANEIVMDNPIGGIKRGWEEIRAVYEHIFNGPAKVYVEFYDYTIHETGEMFYAVGRERGEFRIGETAIKLAIRTSRIYKLINGQWRQVHHHGSIDDPELLARYQSAVKGGG